MDALMFEKAKQFEEKQDIEKALFYYNRTLDYNPLHCDALERLSDLYTRQHLYKENLELFTNLRIRGANVSCEATLTTTVCDSMSLKVTSLIEQRNYYDAVKLLDTLELLFNQMHGNACLETYLALRKQAQDGIYASYLEVINRAIKGNKIDLCKDYIYGLIAIMDKDRNLPSENLPFMQMIERFIAKYKENVKNVLKKKKYEEVIRSNDAMLVFLDSIRCRKEEELFFESYSISYTEIYLQKKQRSEEEAMMFFASYEKYITFSNDEITENQMSPVQELSSENTYDLLVNYVFKWNVVPDDFSILDHLVALLQWEKEKEYTVSAIDHLFIEQRIIPLVTNALSKINQYAWTNEFSSATELIKKIDEVMILLNLTQELSDVSEKYFQTSALLQQRINERAEIEYHSFSLKIKKMVEQKLYFQAYHLLKTENLYLQKTVYQKQINQLIKEVEIPALFEEKMTSVEQSLALGDYPAAFAKYEEAHLYFLKNNLSQYGLTCDDLFTFIKTGKRENLLRAACWYYMADFNYRYALDLMMYIIDLGYKNNDIQVKLGSAMRKSSYKFSEISEKYTFTKVHKPFLEHFLGKFGYLVYCVRCA
jgi:hypothetical protein